LKPHQGYGLINKVAELDVFALAVGIVGAVTGIAGVITATISIRIARRSATADETSAIAAKTATEIAQQQLAIERDRHRAELAERHQATAPALEGRIRRPDEPYGSEIVQAELEIRVTDTSELLSLTVIFPARSPAMPRGKERLMEQWIPYPEAGNAIIDAGHPARLNVTVSGNPEFEPFTIQVIAHADYGLKWDRLPVQVTFY
jgi:hypothetical protein